MNFKNILSVGLFICFLSTSLVVKAQKGGPNSKGIEDSFEWDTPVEFQQSESDSLITWQERILLHIDKPIINEGSPLFFKAYTLTGPNRVRATLSKVLKVELVNQSKDVLATQYHKIEEGMSEGAFIISKKLQDGNYTLRAYTRWMQNYGESFYVTKKLILGTENVINSIQKTNMQNLEVSFYPEGGNLITNFNNRLLIKATTKDGNPIDIKGDIVDGAGNKVMPLVSFDNGMMSAIFQPKPNAKYSLKTTNGSIFKLPEVKDTGYLLNVNNLNSGLLNIRVQASPEMVSKAIWIQGTMSGVTYFRRKLDLKTSVAELEISKTGIPFGVMMVSLIDENDNQMAKRPAFIDADNSLNLSVIPLDKNTNEGELAFKVSVTNKDGNPITTQVSISATNAIAMNTNKTNEQSSFAWEREELNGTGKNLARTNRFIKDLELLTSSKNDIAAFQNLPDRVKYPFQIGLDLFGYAYDLNNTLLKNTKIQMLSTSDDNAVVKEFDTDGSGRIRLENMQLVGDNELIFRTTANDTKSRLVKLVPIQESYDKNHKPKSVLAFEKQKNRETVQTSPWEPINSDNLVELDEVAVIEKKIERPRAMSEVYGIKANKNKTIVQDVERPRFLFQLFAELPGVMVSGSSEAPSVSLISNSGRGSGSGTPNNFGSMLDQSGPLWVIDGFIWGNSPGVDPEMGLTAWDIDRIELPERSDWSIYGSRAALGVIMVYTRNGSDIDYINRKEGRLNFQGYYDSPSFDSYSAQLAKRPKRYENKATTLFWNPNIETDENGEAIVRFTPPIEYQNIEIKVSAVTENGEIASTKTVY